MWKGEIMKPSMFWHAADTRLNNTDWLQVDLLQILQSICEPKPACIETHTRHDADRFRQMQDINEHTETEISIQIGSAVVASITKT